jgi:hypothetical protein
LLSDATVAVSDAAAYTNILKSDRNASTTQQRWQRAWLIFAPSFLSLSHVISAGEQVSTSALARLQAQGCNVIVSSVRQHQSVLQLCLQSRIALVQVNHEHCNDSADSVAVVSLTSAALSPLCLGRNS